MYPPDRNLQQIACTLEALPLQGSRVRCVQTQGSPLRGQPWAAEFNSFGVSVTRELTLTAGRTTTMLHDVHSDRRQFDRRVVRLQLRAAGHAKRPPLPPLTKGGIRSRPRPHGGVDGTEEAGGSKMEDRDNENGEPVPSAENERGRAGRATPPAPPLLRGGLRARQDAASMGGRAGGPRKNSTHSSWLDPHYLLRPMRRRRVLKIFRYFGLGTYRPSD